MTDPTERAHGSNAIARWTRLALTALVSIVMFAMMMLTTADVAGRYFFNTPIKGSFEIVTFLLAILVFSSLPLISWDQKHITVNLFEHWIPPSVHRWLGILLSIVSTLVVAGITERMWVHGNLMAEGQHITGFLEWPIAPIAYYMSALSALTTIVMAVLTWQKITGTADTRPHGPEDEIGVE